LYAGFQSRRFIVIQTIHLDNSVCHPFLKLSKRFSLPAVSDGSISVLCRACYQSMSALQPLRGKPLKQPAASGPSPTVLNSVLCRACYQSTTA
ncbi:MAG: hypothetical protein LBD24_07295, partial [Spirochaetaceae bacterium]|nr:hypothetical protein [Spirochaetaceae bacterium]